MTRRVAALAVALLVPGAVAAQQAPAPALAPQSNAVVSCRQQAAARAPGAPGAALHDAVQACLGEAHARCVAQVPAGTPDAAGQAAVKRCMGL